MVLALEGLQVTLFLTFAGPWLTGLRYPLPLGIAIGVSVTTLLTAVGAVWSCYHG